MELIVWSVICGGVLFLIWYGYGLLVGKPGAAADGYEPVAACHLCRRELKVADMVARDKVAGFINYFCSDCIESLYNDYTAQGRDRVSQRISVN